MKTFIADFIPQIQRFSQKLDNLKLLTNQHWVIVDNDLETKHAYIFRDKNELLISQNGRVEKAKWEYIGVDSLLIDKNDESFLFRHGFFDENILALKIDGKANYVFFVNESKANGELNTIDQITAFLKQKYFTQQPQPKAYTVKEPIVEQQKEKPKSARRIYSVDAVEGKIEIFTESTEPFARSGDWVYLNGEPAPTGKYHLKMLWNIHVKNGRYAKDSFF